MDYQIRFRSLRLEDARFINDLRREDEVEKLIGGAKRPVAYERDLKWVEDLLMKDDQRTIYFAVTSTDNDEIIGYTSISDIDYRNGTCFWSGIKVDTKKASKGIGSQVALKILKFVFEELRMERCKAECLEEHHAAKRMMEKVGYKIEALMRCSVFKNGKHNNQYLLSVIREDYALIKEQYAL